jgi:hypothetical protein
MSLKQLLLEAKLSPSMKHKKFKHMLHGDRYLNYLMHLQRIYEYFHLFVKGKILSEHMFEFFVLHAGGKFCF